MGAYETPLTAVHRKLNQTTVLSGTKFQAMDKINIGNRMAMIRVPNTQDVIVWSPMPQGEEFDKALKTLSVGEELQVIAGVIPNRHHALCAQALKEKYPNLTLIGPSGINDKPGLKLDYVFEESQGNKVINGSEVNAELSNFDFLYLKGHKNGEVLMVDNSTKTLYESDLLFNVPYDGKNEDQYPGECQNKGLWGMLGARTNYECMLGRHFSKKLFPKTAENVAALKQLMGMSFDSIVLSHGVIIEKDGKGALHKLFGGY
jgi:hypothetical protein